jgi:hypothetical protein
MRFHGIASFSGASNRHCFTRAGQVNPEALPLEIVTFAIPRKDNTT